MRLPKIARVLVGVGLVAVVAKLCLALAYAGELELTPADRGVPLGIRPDTRQQSTLNQTPPEGGAGGFRPLLDLYPYPEHYVREFAGPVGLLALRFEISGVPLVNGLPPVKDARCTATLIAADLIITAHHCVPGDEPAAKLIEARLFLGWDQDGIDLDSIESFKVDTEPVTYDGKLNASPGSKLDYAIIQVRPNSNNKLPGELFSPIPVKWQDLRAGVPLLIIQHPDGQAKRVTRDCHHHKAPVDQLLIGGPNGREFRHRCATRPGSSGALVFQDYPPVILGLHNKGSFVHDFQTSQYNEAVAFSRIMSDPNSTVLQTLDRTRMVTSTVGVARLRDEKDVGGLNAQPLAPVASGPALVPTGIKAADADSPITRNSSAPEAKVESVKLPDGLTPALIATLTLPGLRDIEPPSRIKWTRKYYMVEVDSSGRETRTHTSTENGVSDISKTRERLWVIRSESKREAQEPRGTLTDYTDTKQLRISLPGDVFAVLTDSTERYGPMGKDAGGLAKRGAPSLSSASKRVTKVVIEGGGSCSAQSCSISYLESCKAQGLLLACQPDSAKAGRASSPRVGSKEEKKTLTIKAAQDGTRTVVSLRTGTEELTQLIEPGFGVISAKSQRVIGSGKIRFEQIYTVDR